MPKSRDSYVLAVDDDAAYLSVLKLCMRTCGFNKIYTATDAASALEHIERIQFDLILSDYNMSPTDGLELLRIIRECPSTAKTPFILMSANLSERAWHEAIDLGVTEFLVKPFSLGSLRFACAACRGAKLEISHSPYLHSQEVQAAMRSGRAFATRADARSPDATATAAEADQRIFGSEIPDGGWWDWQRRYEKIKRIFEALSQ